METQKITTKTREHRSPNTSEIERQGALLQQCDPEHAPADPERSIGALLFREFEIAHSLAEHRRIERAHDDGTVEEFVFRDQSGTRAEECMRIELDREGKIVSAMCQTDFGFPDDPQYLVGVRRDGSYVCAVQQYHNDSENDISSYEWHELSGEAARELLARFGTITTRSLEAIVERSDEEQQHADEAARKLTLNRQRFGGSVIEAGFLVENLI